MALSFEMQNGAPPPIDLPAPGSDQQSVLAFSMAKAGSTLLFNLLHDLAPLAGLAYFSAEDALWELAGGPDGLRYDPSGLFREAGYCYGGFRIFPTYPIPLLESAPSVLLLRDPKDMMVSNYFSNAFSHRPPTEDETSPAYQRFMQRRERIQNTDINQYVRTILGNYQKMLASYRGLWHRDGVKVFRYEDIINRKREWIDEILAHYGWRIADEAVDEIITRYNVFPDAEQPDAHVRQVSPGNYRNHLDEQTVKTINTALGEDLHAFGYPV